MYNSRDIRVVHLEVTTHCNAACPQCPRNYESGQPNEQLPQAELTIDDVKSIFNDSLIKQLHQVYLCGNYGDPAVGRDTLEIVTYLRGRSSDLKIGIHSNGGARTPKWWTLLANQVSYCRFAIDGLENTNSIYRRGTSWSRVMNNLAAFVEAGGIAEWAFIAFEHNQHQIDQAREMSKRLGVSRFLVKRTPRFRRGQDGTVNLVSVRNRNGEELYKLSPPTREALRHPNLDRKEGKPRLPKVVCQAAVDASIYISAEGMVFPCCYVAHIYQKGKDWREHEVVRLVQQNQGDLTSLNAKYRPIADIIDSRFFNAALPNAWRAESVGRLSICDRVCGNALEGIASRSTFIDENYDR